MKKFIALLFVICFAVGGQAAPTKLVLFMGFSIHDAQIGPAADAAKKRMIRDYQIIANELDLEFILVDFEPENVKGSDVSEMLHDLPTGNDVIVVNTWLAHGFNTTDYSRDNTGYIGLADEAIKFYDVHSYLKDQDHHLLISSVESCQGIHNVRSDQIEIVPLDPENLYSRLFVETTGDILISSGSPGELSWVETANGWAPLHDNILLAIRNSNVRMASSDSTWEEVLQEATTNCATDVRSLGRDQSPHFTTNIRYIGEQDQGTPPALDPSKYLIKKP